MLKHAGIVLCSLLVTAVASAHHKPVFNGKVPTFSFQEKSHHKQNIEKFMEVGQSCLKNYWNDHIQFYNRHGFSKYFGNRRFSKSRGEIRADGAPLTYLKDGMKAAGIDTRYFDQMENISCVDMALRCLRAGLKATGQEELYTEKLRPFLKKNGVSGMALIEALRNLGWTVYYWNPTNNLDVMARWDREEKSWDSIGYHAYRYRNVTRRGLYYKNHIDDGRTMVNFGDGVVPVVRRYNFWIGSAHTGYHVFPGFNETVLEAHSTRALKSVDNLEKSIFAPMMNGGGPRWSPKEKYRSGLVAIPPAQ